MVVLLVGKHAYQFDLKFRYLDMCSIISSVKLSLLNFFSSLQA